MSKFLSLRNRLHCSQVIIISNLSDLIGPDFIDVNIIDITEVDGGGGWHK